MRTIQDSDDEFDEDLEAEAPQPKQSGAIEESRYNQLFQSGTGSTESLQKAIQKAHRAHLQSQPSQYEPHSSAPLSEHPSKKRRTSININQGKSDPGSYTRKSSSTFDKRSKPIFSSSFTGLKEDPTASERGVDHHASSHQTSWDFEGGVRTNYTNHDSIALFHEPSSTVPNATLTQQRVMEGVRAPTMLGEDLDVEASCYQLPPEPSVPWSDLMKFSPANTGEQADSSEREYRSSYKISATPVPSPQNEQGELGVLASTKPLSSCSRYGSLQHEVADDNVNLKQMLVQSGTISPIPGVSASPAVSPKYHRKMREDADTSPHRRKNLVTLLPSSDDDLAVVGLHEEQYKPRPSRSRSLIVGTEQMIVHSLRPENAVRVSKRRKTTAATIHANPTTPQKIQQICDMGFTPVTTQRALKQHSGNVPQTVDWLVSNNVGEDELAPRNTPKRNTARKSIGKSSSRGYDDAQRTAHKQDEECRHAAEILLRSIESQMETHAPILPDAANNEKHSPIKTMSPAAVRTKNAKVQVIISKKSPKSDTTHILALGEASDKNLVRRKTTSDLREPEAHHEQRVAPKETLERKKCRGRPKKEINLPLSTDTISEVLEETAAVEQHIGLLKTIAPELALPQRESADFLTTFEADDEQIPAPEVSSRDSAIPCAPHDKPIPTKALRDPEKSAERSGRSPMNKGKVPHRVGLSKRARIAPLLRTLKK
ncbi:hypothetical protein BKA66DRAFT_440951 [Pyrenochaeta sp. MPI-SDFR-AT-0127]|nr:hypothetical protein BKA66DRAFT_440951 [Pyrenochaeta sp. MPI-SDFR-AT-0127]